MPVYMLVFSLISICGVICTQLTKEKTKRLYIILCLIILALSLWFDIGLIQDAPGYYQNLLLLKGMTWSEVFKEMIIPGNFEPGYIIFIKLISYITDDIRVFINIKHLIIFTVLFVWMYKESKFPVMSLGIFVAMGQWLVALVNFRQEFATIILVVSIKYLREKRFLNFALLVLLATSFHRSAVVFILLYFSNYIQEERIGLLTFLAIVFSLVFYFFGGYIFVFFEKFTRNVYGRVENGGMNTLLVLWIITLLTQVFCRSLFKEKREKIYYLMVLIAAALQSISLRASLWSRIVVYFTIGVVILLPDVFCHLIRLNHRRWSEAALYGAFSFVLLFWCYFVHMDHLFRLSW